ncbi:phospholipase D family protein [Enterococcus gallinarum]|uniref:phospholipase D family protein n=1 Tax=Enterococcus TaxID=1350 RepID=UPI00232EDA5C|nr:phospholipase D family protein [Enterococcus gallinarum]MEB6051559.1 phospholipase D family protein [Enterococcus gallinarum]WCG08708.1 phospholipase D family protein [Enterococcus gallinarum]
MKIHIQPSDGAFGELLQNQLLAAETGDFYAISAFAKNSGVLTLEDAISAFRSKGGKTTFVVGIDLDGTSIEALKNILRMADSLFVVHSENNITFHPKIYTLSSKTNYFIAIGSNNLTKGGLFNNYESSMISEAKKPQTELSAQFSKILSLYTDDKNSTVLEIKSEDDIDRLAEEGYIHSERDIQKNLLAPKSNFSRKNRNKLFGNEKNISPNMNDKKYTQSGSFNEEPSKDTQTPDDIAALDLSTQNDMFWFETGNMTGGSRNILDLSKKGKLQEDSGSAQNTIYYKDDEHVKGGVLFFGLDPDNSSEKDITINYDGVNYSPATIKYAPANSNWRIQIKGSDDSNKKITTVLPKGSMVEKILVFEKVNSTKYILTIHPINELNSFAKNSIFWATNGTSSNGRRFGYIVNDLED